MYHTMWQRKVHNTINCRKPQLQLHILVRRLGTANGAGQMKTDHPLTTPKPQQTRETKGRERKHRYNHATRREYQRITERLSKVN